MTFHTMRQRMFGVGTHLRSWWRTRTQCEHNYSLPIYFAFHMRDTYFWYAVTLVCICVDVCIGGYGNLGAGPLGPSRKAQFIFPAT